MSFGLYVNPMHLDPNKGPKPYKLTESVGWNKPRVYKEKGYWVCEIVAYLHHGEAVTVEGSHPSLNWAWCIMTDHLIRHNLLPQFADTKGPLYQEKEDEQS